MLGSCIRLIWCHFYSCFLSNWLLAEKFSNCSNSLNFEAKINCNTTEPNVPKWRKTCTGLQFDIVHFNGPQSHILFVGNLWGPCTNVFYRAVNINLHPPVAQLFSVRSSTINKLPAGLQTAGWTQDSASSGPVDISVTFAMIYVDILPAHC